MHSVALEKAFQSMYVFSCDGSKFTQHCFFACTNEKLCNLSFKVNSFSRYFVAQYNSSFNFCTLKRVPLQPSSNGIRVPTNPLLCPLCLGRRVEPTTITSSGWVGGCMYSQHTARAPAYRHRGHQFWATLSNRSSASLPWVKEGRKKIPYRHALLSTSRT